MLIPGVTKCAVDKRAIFAMEDLAVALPSPTTVEIVPILVCWRKDDSIIDLVFRVVALKMLAH